MNASLLSLYMYNTIKLTQIPCGPNSFKYQNQSIITKKNLAHHVKIVIINTYIKPSGNKSKGEVL